MSSRSSSFVAFVQGADVGWSGRAWPQWIAVRWQHRRVSAIAGSSIENTHIILTCTRYILDWADVIADSRINITPVDFSQLSPWKLRDSRLFLVHVILQLSSTSSESSAELSKELRLSSAHAMIFLSQQVLPHSPFVMSWNEKKTWMEVVLISRRNVNPSSRQQTKLFPPTNQQPTAYSRTIPTTRITWCWSSSNKIHHTVLINFFFFQSAFNLDWYIINMGWLLALNERYLSLPKTLNALIFFYHLESIWELALSRIHGFNSDIKIAPFPNEEEEISFRCRKKKAWKSESSAKVSGEWGKWVSPPQISHPPPHHFLTIE